jgi:hypothetical protein
VPEGRSFTRRPREWRQRRSPHHLYLTWWRAFMSTDISLIDKGVARGSKRESSRSVGRGARERILLLLPPPPAPPTTQNPTQRTLASLSRLFSSAPVTHAQPCTSLLCPCGDPERQHRAPRKPQRARTRKQAAPQKREEAPTSGHQSARAASSQTPLPPTADPAPSVAGNPTAPAPAAIPPARRHGWPSARAAGRRR